MVETPLLVLCLICVTLIGIGVLSHLTQTGRDD